MIDSRLPELSKNDFARYNGDVIKKERGAVFMLQLLETGKALYVLAGICVLGIMTRAITKRFYKRLIKESTNLALTKNKSLKELRQKAENTYRMNQGMSDSGAWLEHQLYEMKIMGVNLSGWSSLCMQWTWLCLLAGGLGAFLSYWYRLDTFYIVLYGGGSVLMAMITMLFDNGTAGGWREQLQASLQDYLENVLYPRMARSMAGEGSRSDKGMQERSGLRGVRTIGKREGKLVRRTQPGAEEGGEDTGQEMSGSSVFSRSVQERSGIEGQMETAGAREEKPAGAGKAGAADSEGQTEPRRTLFGGLRGNGRNRNSQNLSDGLQGETRVLGRECTALEQRGQKEAGNRTGIQSERAEVGLEGRGGRRQVSSGICGNGSAGESGENQELKTIRDLDYLRKSLEQIAACREKSRAADENWLRDLRPEEIELIGDILKQYLV